jgi:phage N-6-adenine-methyltransferase
MGRQDWRTPPTVFSVASARWGPFQLDAAADQSNALCEAFNTSESGDPRTCAWSPFTFVNPPFRDIMPWVQKAAVHDGVTVMLTPSNVSSPWFLDATKSAGLFLPDRRIHFWHPAETPGSPDRDTVIWVFGTGAAGRVEPIHIPDHGREVRRLWQESNGQQTIFPENGYTPDMFTES